MATDTTATIINGAIGLNAWQKPHASDATGNGSTKESTQQGQPAQTAGQRHLLAIVEGPDCTGKTSAIRRCQEELGAVVLHYSGGTRDEQVAKFEALPEVLDKLLETNKLAILDRSHLGEYVYGEVFNRTPLEYLAAINRKVLKHEPIVFFFTGKPLKAKTEADVELARDYAGINSRFWGTLARLQGKCRVFCLSNLNNSEAENAEVMKAMLAGKPYNSVGSMMSYTCHQPNEAYEIPDSHPYKANHLAHGWKKAFGPSSPPAFNYAVFGEAPGNKGCGTTGIPFYYDRSGTLLRECFYENNMQLDLCCVSNVIHTTPPDNNVSAFKAALASGDRPDWVSYELKLFEDEIHAALRQTDEFIFIGRTAADAYHAVSDRFEGAVKPTFMLHPAYFLYKHDIDGAKKYYAERLQKLIKG